MTKSTKAATETPATSTETIRASVNDSTPRPTRPASAPSTNDNSAGGQGRNLYMTVKTFDGKTNKEIGFRVVDLFHYGTRNWMASHTWWAMHNGHCVEINVANPDEVAAYVKDQTAALAEKFGGAPPATESSAEVKAIAA